MSAHNSFSGSFRCDINTLAGLFQVFKENGIMVRSISDMVRLVLELHHDLLQKNGKLQPVTDPIQALDILQDLRVTSNNINKQNLRRQLQAEALHSDGFNLDYLSRAQTKHAEPSTCAPSVKTPKSPSTQSPISPAEADAIMAKIRQRDAELQRERLGLGSTPVMGDQIVEED